MKAWKFWAGLAACCGIASAPMLSWAPARFGGIFFGTLAICCAGQALVLRNAKHSAICRFLSRLGHLLFILFVLSFLVVQGVIVHGMQPDPEASEADAVLVLGARVYESGAPSATLAARLDVAKQFLDEHPQALAVLCGGQGDNEPVPEAWAMRDYLLAQGVSADRLILEDASNNTIQNIANAKTLLDTTFGDYRTAVISSDFHLARARRLMESAQLDAYAIPAPTPYLAQRAALHLREYGSIMGLVLTGRW